MAEISRLKKRRGLLKRRITVFDTFLATADAVTDYDEISVRLAQLDGLLSEYEEIHLEIDLLETADENEQYRDDFEKFYYACTRKARKFLKENAPVVHNDDRNSVIEARPGAIQPLSNVRLPKIVWPSFNGAYDQWMGFYDTFKSMVHTKQHLSKIEKLHYLRSCLVDDAATITQSLESTADNYDIAWDLLIERYDNKRVIVQSHMKALLEQPAFTRESAANVRQILDSINKHTRALKTLGQPVDEWDTILIYSMVSKLDKNTHQEWEKTITSKELPTLCQFITFLTNRSQILEATTAASTGKSENFKRVLQVSQRPDHCNFCDGEHRIFRCEEFLKLTPSERLEAIKKGRACFNCLRKGHSAEACTSGPCKTCATKHHTLLHFDRPNTNNTQNNVACGISQTPVNEYIISPSHSSAHTVNSEVQSTVNKVSCGSLQDGSSQIVLATAKVIFFDAHNKRHAARVVLDGGSQAHFISEKFANILKLKRTKANIPVIAINEMETTIRHQINAKIASLNERHEYDLNFLVVPSVSAPLPAQQINSKKLEIPKNLPLADPTYYKPSEIDALIGAELFYKILYAKQISIQNQDAVLQKTKFGWVVAGDIKNEPRSLPISCNVSISKIQNNITRFWELEEIPEKRFFSAEEAAAEKHFLENVYREKTGRYVVKLPFNDKLNELGTTFNTARQQFFALERRLERNPEMKKAYIDAMNDYLKLGHMTRIPHPNIRGNYLPHQAVIKLDSSTTKYRPVFNASVLPDDDIQVNRDKNERITFNQTLLIGPTIQNDIFEILIRFRMHQFALIADIEKMYRQVLVHPDDRKFQQIFWREDPKKELAVYQLNTLTFGTACAPFLAIRTIHKLADDEKEKYPCTSAIVKRDFYVDDLLTGSDTFENAEKLRNDLNNLLKAGGFNLRKWTSNDKRLIETLPSEAININLCDDPASSVKTLGIQWNAQSDHLSYRVKSESNAQEKTTKRNILSNIAQLFDPIGLLGPVIVKAKLIMQNLWKEKVEWDECLPSNIHTTWLEFKRQLPLLSKIAFERRIIIAEPVNIQLHGFCDASEAAYGACIYIRSVNSKEQCLTQLLCSKSKVAPLNSTITIPKLELCAALLLAKLLQTILKVLPIKFNEIFLWSDSTITLNWINTQPHILKTFVANRVSQIRIITNTSQWRHVPTNDNPADFISRGQSALEFINNSIWASGPSWLKEKPDHWPTSLIQEMPLLEVRKITTLKVTLVDHSLFSRFSSITKLIRTIAYCLRFANHSRLTISDRAQNSAKTTELSIQEIQAAKIRVIQLIQNQAFAQEFQDLSKNKEIEKKSKLSTLNPFLDENKLIRVGGRIGNSYLAYDSKHPIVLPKTNHVVDLIIKHEHEVTMHAGIQNTLHQVRTHYWPIDGKNTTRRIVHACVKCFRFRQPEPQHIMGNLPRARITEARPFLNAGIDYCGPFMIKEKKFRNRNKVKIYVAVFVCFATKAIHLEIVSDLTTEAFLACLRRFFARRGKSKNLYSDNGTNFVGANNELIKLQKFLQSDEHHRSISQTLANESIAWHFTPPRAPHFGGLWESAVKLFKSHFLRTVGNTLLTFEEFNTHAIKIEAVLNSRPLTPLSSDPNDLTALTPAHFLINDSLMTVPDVDFSSIPSNRLSNWEYLQQLRQHFWKRWHKEYLNELNNRAKWASPNENLIRTDTMVLLKEDNTSPLQWPLGRITELHPGNDGVVRVVTVKTVDRIFKRSIKKIAILPIE